MRCDIKIMASPKRYAYVLNMCKAIGLDIDRDVFFDDRPTGGDAAYTSEKTWMLPFEDGVTHRCVLQDDLIVCKGFREVLNRLVDAEPDAMFSLFCPQAIMQDFERKHGVPQLVWNKRGGVWGQAIVARREVARDVYDWGRIVAAANGSRIKHDDVLFGEYANEQRIKVFIPVPNIVQHVAPMSSLLGFNNRNKTSKVFNIEAGGLAWEDAKRTSVSIPNSMPFYA